MLARALRRSGFDRLTLRVQIRYLMVGLVLTLLALLGVGTGFFAVLTMRNHVEQELASAAAAMAEKLDRGMFQHKRELGLLAGLGRAGVVNFTDPVEGRAVLKRLQAEFVEYTWIGFAGRSGTVQAATGGLLEGVSVAARPWFTEGLKGAYEGGLHEAPLLQKLLTSAGEEPLRFVDVAFPVEDREGRVTGVLGAHLSWAWADDVRRSVLATADQDAGIEILVLDAEGNIILTSGAEPLGKPVKGLPADRRGGAFYGEGFVVGHAPTIGYRDYQGLGWIVVARQPLLLAFAPLGWLIAGVVIITAAVGLLGVWLAHGIATQVSAPLWRLTQAAHTLTEEGKPLMLPRLRGSREAEELSKALRALIRRLSVAESRGEHSHEVEAAFADQVAKLRILADTDPLTGALNRRAFTEKAEAAVAYAQRYQHPLSILAVDIDHFKKVNDAFGHTVGDIVIQAVAEAAKRSCRQHDLIARFGGEEFVILLKECPVEFAAALAERLRADIAAQELAVLAGQGITVSIGCAALDAERDRLSVAIDRADTALYEAKRTGRNRVVVAASTDQSAAA